MELSKDIKPTTKRKLPAVRQTRTSAYRILKANPLMMHDTDSVKKLGITDTTKVPKTVDILGISSKYNGNMACTSTSTITANTHRCNNLRTNVKSNVNHVENKLSNLRKVSTVVNNKNQMKSNKNNLNNFNEFKTKNFGKSGLSAPVKNPQRQSISFMYRDRMKYITRRSKSAERFDSSKCVKKSIFEEAATKVKVSLSMEGLVNESLLDVNISPIKEKQKVVFKTPTAYNRRSVAYFTPVEKKSGYKSYASTPAPADLQKRLNDWLAKRGKSIGAFHHLKCFGINNSKVNIHEKYEENKENVILETTTNKESPDKLEKKPEVPDYIKSSDNINYEVIARDALNDLHKLIQDSYPPEQCEAWLGRIRQRHLLLEDEPLYWECRAALEQCRGNISSAVEHYRKAIVKGAEVRSIEGSLDQLLEKFSLLNINPTINEEDISSKRIILDARNAFKSTIIQFAVQERMLKKKEEDNSKAFVVTPVRRSTRLSMKHTSASGLKLCASLKEIDMNENTKFKTNSYLSIRFND